MFNFSIRGLGTCRRLEEKTYELISAVTSIHLGVNKKCQGE